MKKSRKLFFMTFLFYVIVFIQFLVSVSISNGSIMPLAMFVLEMIVICIIGSIMIHKFEKQEKKESSCS